MQNDQKSNKVFENENNNPITESKQRSHDDLRSFLNQYKLPHLYDVLFSQNVSLTFIFNFSAVVMKF
jgi:hypothetical protein